MKKIICIILIFSLVFTMASCGKPKPEDEPLTPTLTADVFLKALKARDMDTLQKYYEGDVKDLSIENTIDDPILAAVVEMMISQLLDFDYTLDNEQINGTTATVDITIRTYDIGGMVKDLAGDIISGVLGMGIFNLTEEAVEEKVREILTKNLLEAIKTAEKDFEVTSTVKLVQKGGIWMVKDMNKADDFFYGLSGGLSRLSDIFGNLFG